MAVEERAKKNSTSPAWSRKYRLKHRLERIRRFPKGAASPKKVRIYCRRDHYWLQWWEPALGKTQYVRVDGDLIDALAEARKIDLRLQEVGRSGRGDVRIEHAQLIEQFLKDAELRAAAGSLALGSLRRFRSALSHYSDYTQELPERKYTTAASVDRHFALSFVSWLGRRHVSRNGRKGNMSPMRNVNIILDIVRAMYEWAADRQRGARLPDGFINPFRRQVVQRRVVSRDLLAEPDITVPMAKVFLVACDAYQLKLFAPLIFWGPRPSELTFLFAEHADAPYLRHNCIEELGYASKGLQNKALPWLLPLRKLLLPDDQKQGLLLLRREVEEGRAKPPLLGKSLQELIHVYRQRVADAGEMDALKRERLRDAVLHDAGAINYKSIHSEFVHITGKLQWPASATLKDFRHLAQTCLDNGGMSREQRQYLLGQSMGKAAIVHYLHLNEFAQRYQQAVERSMAPLLQLLDQRTAAMAAS